MLLLAIPAGAQQMQIWPGWRDTNGPTIEIETEDNVRCRYTQGSRPSVSVATLSSNPNTNLVNTGGNSINNVNPSSQFGGGLLLTIPFGGMPVDGCGRLSALQERRSKLALGAALLDQGLITQEQFQQLGAAIARELGIPAALAPALPTRASYNPPAPVGLGGLLPQADKASPALRSAPVPTSPGRKAGTPINSGLPRRLSPVGPN